MVILYFPLLAENPRDDLDATIVIDVDPEVAVSRLVEFRSMDADDARRRIANQASREQRLAIATHVIDNSGGLEALRSQVDAVWAAIAPADGLAA